MITTVMKNKWLPW